MERVLIDGVEQGIVAILQVLGVGLWLFHLQCPARLLHARAAAFSYPRRLLVHVDRTLPLPRIAQGASAMNALLLDNLQGVRQIKSYAREETELERFSASARQVGETQLVIMRTWSWYSSGMTWIGALGSVIVLYVGGNDVLAGQFTAGGLVTFLLFVGMFYEPIGRLHQINQLYQAGRASSERVSEILDHAQGTLRNSHRSAARPGAGPSRVSACLLCLPPRCAGAARHHAKRETRPMHCAGRSDWSGKSTLVSLLSRFYESTGGEILLDGRNIQEIPLLELREQIGVVSQETFLFNGTILDNLRFGRPSATRAEIEQMARAACVHEFVSLLPEGYDTHVGERGVKLSVGEKQRISIARALLKDPPVLVLDEATASVDNTTERLIQEALQRMLVNRTSFVIAHRLSTVRHADLILVLQKGRIVERGTHEELIARTDFTPDCAKVRTVVAWVSLNWTHSFPRSLNSFY